MRCLGYDLPSAIADIIDNSITAGAKNINIEYAWNNGDPYIMILDDGDGMSEEKLDEAMTPGSTKPSDERELHDLGRFGLGLKTASWSQAKRVSVYTKQGSSVYHLTWDLDHVAEVDEWEVIEELSNTELSILKDVFEGEHSGTAVLWTNLDRVLPPNVDEERQKGHFLSIMIELVIPHLSMIFHRYLSSKNGINISVGMTECEPWDPFMSSHESTEEIHGEKYEDNRIVITPYILPHSSKLASPAEREEAEGIRGWDANQGFFVYRRNRMIIAGGYFDLGIKTNPSHRLARIKVDLTNEFDLEWKVDIRKEDVIPPSIYREQLKRIANSTMNRSSRRYVARTTTRAKPRKNQSKEEVWLRKQVGEKIQYRINLDAPGIQAVLTENNLNNKAVKQLLYLVERTIPYRSITLDNNEMEDATENLPGEAITPPPGMFEVAMNLVRNYHKSGDSIEESITRVTQDVFPGFGADFRVKLEDEFLG